LNSWTDAFQLNNGWLVGLADLDTESDYVRERIAAYFTDLLSVGFSGFRMDAAKHIQPASIAAIFAKFKANLGGGDLPDDWITWLEVLLGGEKDLLMCNPNSGYNYGQSLTGLMKAAGLSDNDVYRVKIW
jgi:alpha-amylase